MSFIFVKVVIHGTVSLTSLSKKAWRIGFVNRRYVHDDTKSEKVKALWETI